MSILRRLTVLEIFTALRLAALGEWWAARAAARLRARAKNISQG